MISELKRIKGGHPETLCDQRVHPDLLAALQGACSFARDTLIQLVIGERESFLGLDEAAQAMPRDLTDVKMPLRL